MAPKKEYQIRLKKFDWSMVKRNATVAMIGGRGSGKSTCMRDMLYHFRDFPIGTVVSPTEKMNRSFSEHVPPMFIHDKCTDELMRKILHRQELVVERQREDPEFANVDPSAFLVLDDCMYDQSWQKSEEIRKIYFNGRHYLLLSVLALQDALGLQIGFRNNTDWAFIFRTNNTNNIHRLYQHFCGMFPTEAVFKQVLNQVTTDFGCLVVNMAPGTSADFTEQVFWYKAEQHPEPWRTCLDVFWEQSRREQELEQQQRREDDGEPFDHQMFAGGKNGVRINVRRVS